jgi:AcrR family transcriptional regulator
MTGGRPSSRKKILVAAAELATEAGPGRLSLEAVAARAGVSKGGLLYNFPTKAKLMQGLVETYLEDFTAALDDATGKGEPLLAAYVRLSLKACEDKRPPASWIFTAMAEDPDFLVPINTFRRKLVDRLRAEAPDPTTMLVAYLAIEGLRSIKLFGSDVFDKHERSEVATALMAASRAAGA